MKNKRLSSCERREFRPKHCALTKFLRHHDLRRAYDLEKIVENCDVSSHIGCLPPELRNLVNKNDLSQITAKFFDLLDFIVVDKYIELLNRTEIEYNMPDVSHLFNTKCVLKTCELLPGLDCAYKTWGGAVSDVYKLSFPEISVSYALKIFKRNLMPTVGHGPIYEIPTAFSANKSEPKLNNPIYMANFFGAEYMLCKWVYIKSANQYVPSLREHAIYKTSDDENEPRNYCDGKRLDFGKTRKTYYGRASYPVRKLYRQMEHMNSKQLKELESKQKNNFDKRNFQQAQDIIYYEYVNQMSGR